MPPSFGLSSPASATTPAWSADRGEVRIDLRVGADVPDAAAARAAGDAAEILERRLAVMGWTQATVQREGARSIVVIVPDLLDEVAARFVCGTVGVVSVHFVAETPSLFGVGMTSAPSPAVGVANRAAKAASDVTDDRSPDVRSPAAKAWR